MDRCGIFAGDDPFAIARDWLDQARETEVNDPNAMALATVDTGGLPNVRMVLLKDIDPDGFVFFTNYESQKAHELEGGQAAFVLHWKSLRRQLRVRGQVDKVSAERSRDYYLSRHPESRRGAWASQQSQVLSSRAALLEAVAQLPEGIEEKVPAHWGGYKITPQEIEFWADGEYRLHDRFRWQRVDTSWRVERLNP